MAAPQNFKVVGKGTAPASDDLSVRFKKELEGAIEQGVMKAITSDTIIAGGELDETVLSQKIGKVDKDNPSGILARTQEYISGLKKIENGFEPGSMTYSKYRMTINASALQNILVEEAILSLPPTPKEEPPATPPEQLPPKEEDKKDPPPAEPPPEKKDEQDKEKEEKEKEEEEEDEKAQEPEPEEEEPEAKTPPKKIPSENPSKTKSEMEIVGETHFVITRKDPLRIRTGPSLKNKVIGRLPKGSRLRVINEYLGEDCSWDKVEIVDENVKDAWTGKSLKNKFKDRVGSLYCFSDLLDAVEGVPKSLTVTCDFEIKPDAPEIDWKKIDPMGMSCFYNLRKGEYQAVVEMPYQNETDMEADYDSFEQSRSDVIEVGVRKLLRYYNKFADEEEVKRILNAFKGAYIPTGAEGFYLDKRPGSFMRFLVCFPAKYFNALQEAEVDLSNATEENTDPDLRSYSFAYSSLVGKIEMVAKRMEKYAVEVDNFDGRVEYVNLKKEAERLREFPTSLNKFLGVNGHPTIGLKKELNLEFGLGKDFKLEWVFLSEDDKKTFPLKIAIVRPEDSTAEEGSLYKRLYPDGFGFKFVEPIKNGRTLAFIYFLDKMVDAINKGKVPSVINGKETLDDLNWSKFLESFVYPMPNIFPSGQKEKDRGETNPSAKKAEKIAKDKEKRHKKPPGIAKTTSELERESIEISLPDLKNALARGRAKAKVLVGDNLFDELEHLLKSISCAEDLYTQLLNNYSITSIAEIVLSFVSSQIPFPDLEKLKLESALDMISTDKIDGILDEIKNIDPKLYEDALRMAQDKVEELKEAGMQQVEDLQEQVAEQAAALQEQLPDELKEQFANIGLPTDSPDFDIISVATDVESSASDLFTSPSGKNPQKKTVSPTKIGKVQNKSQGIDFGSGLKLEGSGEDLFSKLSPKIRKQLKAQIEQLESQLDDLIEQKKEMLKEMMDQGIAEAEQLVRDKITEYVPKEVLDNVESLISGDKSIDDLADEYSSKYLQGRKIPSIPTLSLPDNLPTEDPMESIVSEIESSIEEGLCEALIGMVTPMLKELKKVVDDLLKGKNPDFGKLLDKKPELMDAFKDAFKDVTDLVDMMDDQLEEMLDPFLDEVFGSLTGAEVADLLEGKASEEVKSHINSVVKHKHPEFKDHIKDTTDIENVFTYAGDILGDELVEEAREPSSTQNDDISTTGLLCDDSDIEEDLGGIVYGDRLSGERAKQQDKAEKKRLKDLAKQLSDLIDNGGQVDTIPTDFSCPDGLMPKNIPALSHANNMAIDALFSPIKMSFNRDLMNTKDALVDKKSRIPQPGEPEHALLDDDAPEILGPKDSVNTVKREVSPNLRASLRSKDSFVLRKEADQLWSLDFLSSATRVQKKSATEDPAILNLRQKIDASKKELQSINEDIEELKQEFGEDFEAPVDMTSRRDKLSGDENIVGSIKSSEKVLEEVMKTSIEIAKTNQTLTVDNVKSIVYGIAPVTEDPKAFKDNYQVSLVNTPFLENETEPFLSFSSENSIQNQLELSPSEETDESNLFQAEAFASFVRAKIEGSGLSIDDKEIQSMFVDSSTTGIYAKLFLDLTKKAAKQVAASPLFEVNNFDKVKILPNFTPTSLCAEDSLDNQDLLGLAQVTDQVKESYNDQCEPIDKKEGEMSVFEKESRVGIVKTTARLFMAESLIKSIFCFTEWSPQSLLGERLFLDFIMHKMKTGLEEFNPAFYRDMCLTSKQIVEDMLKKGNDIENTYDIIDLDILLNEENPEHEYGEEALKFVAMQQLPDLLNRLESKLGSPTKPLNKRFTDPPATDRREAGTETTAPGTNLSPSKNGGWIRTIDAPSNHIYGGQVTSVKNGVTGVSFSQEGNRFLKASRSGPSALLNRVLDLRYPELRKECGTFFIEKYIRVEDKTQISDGANEELANDIRTRNGGPLEPSEQEGVNIAHTSGVVNMSTWVSYMKELKDVYTANQETAAIWSSAQSSQFFKPLRYGMRLIWLPPMNPNGVTSLLTKNQNLASISAVEDLNNAMAQINKQQRKNLLFKDSDDFSMIEEDLFKSFAFTDTNNAKIFRKEKAYITQEEVFISTDQENQNPKFEKIVRPVFTLPLITVESDIEGDPSLDDFTKDDFFDFNSDIDINSESPLAKLREEMIDSEEYDFLFNYVFPINRITSLITIYNSNAVSLMNPRMNSSFHSSKETCRSLYYTLSADESQKWWQKQDATVAELGGNAGLLQKDQMNQSVDGPSVDVASLAAMTVPILVRGLANYFDPHYQQVSALSDLGVPFIRKDWSSILPLWPVNFPFGWGAPLTMFGAMAYSMPMLEGDKRRDEGNETNVKAKDPNNEEPCDD